MLHTTADHSCSVTQERLTCFHCGLPVPPGVALSVAMQETPRPMCCPGCQSIAQTIVDSGLDAYYQHRTAMPESGATIIPDALRQHQVYDHPDVQQSFVRHESENICEASLILEGVTCGACVWLIEHQVTKLLGVQRIEINYSTRRARVYWDRSRIKLSEVLQEINRIGYVAHPYDSSTRQDVLEAERKKLLQRLGVAGVLGMQVMVLAVALYSGEWYGIELEFARFFRRVSLILTIPVLLYSAQPFLLGAWRDISNKRAGMDVPISLGILLAFTASVWATVTDEGHIYYDSVVMFVFFLLGARYLELVARKRGSDQVDELAHATPSDATRLDVVDGGRIETVVPAVELKAGDLVLVRPGETVPVDGEIVEGSSTVDESLWTGESVPETRNVGQEVIGGSVNIESPLVLRVTKTGSDTVLAHVERLLERAQSEKPKLARAADKIAGWFVGAVLCLAAATAVFWWIAGNDQWLPITIAVLVVSCPCALSLATPTAITAATHNLLHQGVLVTRADALESLARATHFVFDKTGTLTKGRLRISAVHPFASKSEAECTRIAASLERFSEHPIAKALTSDVTNSDISEVSEVRNIPGQGMCGVIEGEFVVIGNARYVREQTGWSVPEPTLQELERTGSMVVLLANRKGLLCGFCLEDTVRSESADLVRSLKDAGKVVMLLTGDRMAAAHCLGQKLGISEIYVNMTPEKKLEKVKELHRGGATVAMIGDGVNDAPVLGQAQVSAAVAGAAPLAEAAADLVLLKKNLLDFKHAIVVSSRTFNVIRQNLTWALCYNIVAIPVAALGYLAPWLAALGMSLSSVVVVMNALRLRQCRAKAMGV